MNNIQEILERIHTGKQPVSAELLPLVYDELRSLAAGYMSREAPRQTLQPTALVHEAWLRLAKGEALLFHNRAHFFRTAAQAMRRILVDRARSKWSLKRGDGAEKFDLQEIDLAQTTIDERVPLVDEALNRLERENPEVAQVVSLKFFGGLTEKEIAAIHGVTERTVRRQWAFARTRLFQMLQEENHPSASQ